MQKVILGRPDLTSGQFRIVLAGKGPWDRIVVRAEAAEGLDPAAWQEASRALAAVIRAATGASAEVTLIPLDSLARTAGKTPLIERT